MPRQSYASPWAVASPKHAALVRRQGRLEESLVQTVVNALETYLDTNFADEYNSSACGRDTQPIKR